MVIYDLFQHSCYDQSVGESETFFYKPILNHFRDFFKGNLGLIPASLHYVLSGMGEEMEPPLFVIEKQGGVLFSWLDWLVFVGSLL